MECPFTFTGLIDSCIQMLKIQTIFPALNLWKLTRLCKQLRLQCPSDQLNLLDAAWLRGFQSSLEFEIRWVWQHLVNVVLFGMKHP